MCSLRPLPNQEQVSQKRKIIMKSRKIIEMLDYDDVSETQVIDIIVDMRDYFSKGKSIFQILEEKAEREVA